MKRLLCRLAAPFHCGQRMRWDTWRASWVCAKAGCGWAQ